MSAITAIVHWDGRPVEKSFLESANACVSYRCPDGSWVWANGTVGMAQADLATLPEDEPGTPVVSGQLRIAASCRIDNRDEIKRALSDDCAPRSNTDAALILSAYQAWDETCVDRLIGDFSFIIWDGYRRKIFAARDISGVRQLYYYCDQQKLIIASDRTQIFQDHTIHFEVDEEQLIECLTPVFQCESGFDQGFFRGFRALSAGSLLQAEQGKIAVRPFWEWEDKAPDHRPKKQVLEEYIHTLEEAVRCRLRSRSPIAIELSGGLDSSAIASLAARMSNGSRRELHTISQVFDEVPEVDERDRIQEVLNKYPQLTSHFHAADRDYALQYLRPDWSPKGVLLPYEIGGIDVEVGMHNLVEHAGCRVVLTGWVGDSINQGSDRVYFDLLRRRRITEAIRWFKIDWNRSRMMVLRRLLIYGLIPLMTPFSFYQTVLMARERRRKMKMELPAYINPHLGKRINEMDKAIRLQNVKRLHVRCPAARWILNMVFPPMLAVTMPLPQPIETRHPYFDRRIVEMSLSMPKELQWDPEERGIFRACRLHHREAMRGILPDKVRVGNVGVDFTPAYSYNYSRSAVREWLMSNKTIHIFERGYVLPDLFLDAITKKDVDKRKEIENIIFDNWTELMLGVEAFLRAIAPNGQMYRNIPKRCDRIMNGVI